MGSRTSRHHKATSPYSSWGQSFDDLLCGPGKICAEEWTPLPSRTHSLSPTRRRRHSIAISSGGAEVYTVRRSSYSDGVINQQPLPIHGDHIRSPYHLPPTSHSRRNRRRSYHPREPSVHSSRRPVTPWNPRVAKKKKKKRKRSMHRVDTYPAESSRRATSEIVEVHRHRSRTRSKSSTSRKKPSRLDGRPPWRDVISSRQYQEYLDPSPIAVVPPFNPSAKGARYPLDSNSPPYKFQKKKSSSYKASSIIGSNSTGSSGARVVPPRDKTGAVPPPAFRVKHLEDKKYQQRMPTAFPGKKY